MIDFTQAVPLYITDRKNQIRLVLLTAAFALVFINVYSPFGVSKWYQRISELEFFFYSSLIILTGVLVVAVSRLLMYRYTHKAGNTLNLGQYLLWVAAEIISMALMYAFQELIFLNDSRHFLDMYKVAALNTSLVLLLPYSTLWLYFSYLHKIEILSELNLKEEVPVANNPYIAFRDEKGVMRLSLKLEDLYYMKGADNYVEIVYRHNDKHSRYHLRSSLKRLQEELVDTPVIRCHRSYLVNVEKVKLIRRDPDGLKLVLDSQPSVDLPVSRTYIDEVFKQFGAGSAFN